MWRAVTPLTDDDRTAVRELLGVVERDGGETTDAMGTSLAIEREHAPPTVGHTARDHHPPITRFCRAYRNWRPPSTTMVCPVTNALAGPARYSAVPTMSSG